MNSPAWLHDNLGLKALSLLLALLLWLFVTGGGEGEKRVSVRLELKNLAPGLAVASKPVEQVDLRLAGPRIDLAKIAAEGMAIPLDLQGAGEGAVVFPSPEKVLRLPAGVRVTRVSPATIELRLVKAEPQKTP